MTIRTILASTMQQAMQEAKRELGEDAIIISSRRVDDFFEVTVTDDETCLQQSQNNAPAPGPVLQEPQQSQAHAAPAAPGPRMTANDPALQKLLTDLRAIGDHWENIGGVPSSRTRRRANSVSEQLSHRLACLQLEEHISESLLQQFRDIPDIDRAWHLALAQLQSHLTPPRVDILADGGAYAFVGPSGAGKTASIAKLAAEYVLLHGAHNIALITTDAFRIGASEQLLRLGSILGVEVTVVERRSQGLSEALAGVARKRTVLIDSAGLGSNDEALSDQLADIRRQGERINSLLVIPANIQYASMQAAYQNYLVQPYAGCVITRLDESDSLGAAVSLAFETKLPLAYVASGHAIPEDLHRIDGEGMIEHLLSFAGKDNNPQSTRRTLQPQHPVAFAQQLRLAF